MQHDSTLINVRHTDSGRDSDTPFLSTRYESLSTGQQLEEESSCTETWTIDQFVRPSDLILVAAWTLVVSLHAFAEEIIFDVSLAEHAPGIFPFRINLPGGSAKASELKEIVKSSLEQILTPKGTDKAPSQQRRVDNHLEKDGSHFSLLRILSSESTGNNVASAHFPGGSVPLVVTCRRLPESTKVSLEASATQFAPAILRSILGHFGSAVAILSSDHDITLDDVNLFHDPDFDTVQAWSRAPDPIAAQPLLHKVLEEQARVRPLDIAVGQTNSVMTYGELNEGANALAKYLISIIPHDDGVGNIGIFFSKSAFAVLAMLAILKAGGAFVPIDIQWPVGRIEKVLTRTRATAILSSEDQEMRLKDNFSVRIITVSPNLIYTLKKKIKDEGSCSLPSVSPEAPAYLMFTSGSTGQPKGIEISHQSITTAVNAMALYLDVRPLTRFLQFCAFTFDVSMGEIWITLSRGGRVCMPSEEERFKLDEFILAERCSNALLTPSAAATIDPAVPAKHMQGLALIGEEVKPRVLQRYAPRSTDGPDDDRLILRNAWGPTEASVLASGSKPITLGADGFTPVQRANNIGLPLGCGLFIVSASNPHALAPAYAPGEIAIVGPTLSTGYWEDEAKTKASFRTDLEWAQESRWRKKFGDTVMDRVYLTGDIGRYSEEGDGSIVFMFRRGSGYVKVNGLRIEPGEVEAAVAEAGVKFSSQDAGSPMSLDWHSANVCVLERVVGGVEQQLLACYLAEREQTGHHEGVVNEQQPTSEERRALFRQLDKELREIVPEYMVPRIFVPLKSMPLTTSSKVDRQALIALCDELDWSELVKKYGIDDDDEAPLETHSIN